MIYQPHSADLVTVGSSNEIYRLNLEMGRFQAPLMSESPSLTCLDYSSALNSLAVGGVDGRIEFWDFNKKDKAAEIVPSGAGEISCVKF